MLDLIVVSDWCEACGSSAVDDCLRVGEMSICVACLADAAEEVGLYVVDDYGVDILKGGVHDQAFPRRKAR